MTEHDMTQGTHKIGYRFLALGFAGIAPRGQAGEVNMNQRVRHIPRQTFLHYLFLWQKRNVILNQRLKGFKRQKCKIIPTKETNKSPLITILTGNQLNNICVQIPKNNFKKITTDNEEQSSPKKKENRTNPKAYSSNLTYQKKRAG
ncbi:hypothetical protein RUM43_011376 [Polyplax serrata]|uniref:Uncharacterized protein n=1 Tax=Polyplax serrata TaxID=468196 RepID=A0AAN8NTN0_POLSC